MARTNAREFTLRLSKYPEQMEERHAELTKATAMQALGNVVLGTRVDTGRARGNWQAAEGVPPEGHDPNVYDPAGRGVPGGNARDPIAEGSQAVLSASGRDVIWLHNGVPYISILEGLDKMVAGTVEALRTWWRSLR